MKFPAPRRIFTLAAAALLAQLFFAGQVWAHGGHGEPHNPPQPRIFMTGNQIGIEWEAAISGAWRMVFYRIRIHADDCQETSAESCYYNASGQRLRKIDVNMRGDVEYGTHIVCVDGTVGNATVCNVDRANAAANTRGPYTYRSTISAHLQDYSVQIRANTAGSQSGWSEAGKRLRDSPLEPVILGAHYLNGRIHLSWKRTPFPSWFPESKHKGYTLRWLNRDVAQQHSITWLEAAGDPRDIEPNVNLDVPRGNSFINLTSAATTYETSFAVTRGETYGVQVAALNEHDRRSKWTQADDILADPLLFSTGVGDNTARSAQSVSPAFVLVGDLTTHTHHIGPIPHDHNRATVSIGNTGDSAKFKSLGHTAGGQYRTLRVTDAVSGIQTWENIHISGANSIVDLRVGTADTLSTLYRLRVHRFTQDGIMPAPAGLAITPGEYTDDDGVLTPQMVVKWTQHPLAAGYRITCQEISDAANPEQRCEDQVYRTLTPGQGGLSMPAADGTLSYNLRPTLSWGENLQVKLASIHDETAGVFATAAQTIREQRDVTTLKSLSLDISSAPSLVSGDYALEPAVFDAARTEYILRVDFPQQVSVTDVTDAVKIAAVPEDKNAAVTPTLPAAANTAGEHDVAFVVTAENGEDTRTYTVTVIRYPHVQNIVNFHATGGGVYRTTRPFRHYSADNRYEVDLPFAVSSGELRFQPGSNSASFLALADEEGTASTATLTDLGHGESLVSFPVDIPAGGETFTLTASQTDGGYTVTYQFHLARPVEPSADATLTKLEVTDEATNPQNTSTYTLSPALDADTLTYDVTSEVGTVTISVGAHKYATMLINALTPGANDEVDYFVERGANLVEVAVTAENGDIRRYLLRIWYPPPQDAAQIPDVTTLAFSPGTLTPAFSKTVYTYAITGLARGTTSTTVTAGKDAAVTVGVVTTHDGGEFNDVDADGYELPLAFGENRIILQTSASGKTTTLYSLFANVLPPLNADATLHSVTARERRRAVAFVQSGAGATSGAGFAPAHLTYTAEVLQTAQNVHINVTTHELSTFTINGAAATAGEETQVTLSASGGTAVTIVVTAENGGTKTYAFTITRGTANTEPRAPQNLTLTPGDGTLRAVWDAPSSDGGAAVGTYFARYREHDPGVTWADSPLGESGAEVAPAAAAGATTYSISGLPPGVGYEVQVAAANTVGISAWASARATPGGTILHPPQLTLRAADAKITATWATPVDSTGAAVTGITAYRIRHAEGADSVAWARVAGAAVTPDSGGNHSFEITGLKNASVYEVQIAAFKTTRGPWSASESATPAARTLGAPQNLQARGGNHRISLQWESPSAGTPSGFRVRWARVVQTMARAWNERDGVTSALQSGGGEYLIADAEPGAEYELQVAAEDSTGRGDWASRTFTLGAFSLDANGDGKTTAADGIIIARYLLGVETEAGGLFAGQIPPNLTAQQKQTLIANLESGKSGGYLNVDASSATTPDHVDAIFVAKYLLGLRGADLSSDTATQTAVDSAIQALMQ